MSRTIPIVSLDPSLSNFAIAKLQVDVDTLAITIEELILIETEADKTKQMHKQADELRRVREIHAALPPACEGRAFAISEIPFFHAKMYPAAIFNTGVVLGVLGAITIPMIQVGPAEVKLAAVGHRQASKEEMIQWAMSMYPSAPWRMRKLRGQLVPTAANEHLADAVAAAHAGIKTNAFRQALGMFQMMKAA